MESTRKNNRTNKKNLTKINEENLKLLDFFLIYKLQSGIKHSTLTQYECDILSWFLFIYDNQNDVSIFELSDNDIEKYLTYYKEQGNKTHRLKRRLSSIKSMYKYTREVGLMHEYKCEFVKI